MNGPTRSVGALLLAAVLVAGCGRDVPPPQPRGPASVTVARPVVRTLVEWDRYTGRFSAVDAVDVRARVSGYLESIHFQEGAIIEKDALLFVIDSQALRAELDRARAGVQEARAALEQAKAGRAQADAERAESVALAALAASRLERARRAVATNAIAREEVDVRESELQQAEASLEAAKARIASADATVATATAAISTAEAQVHRAEIDLGYCRIYAPITGRIGRRLVTEGNLIDGGSVAATLLASIVSLDPIHCDFDASEAAFLKYSRLAQEGKRRSSRDVKNPVYAALSDERGYPHRGHMDFVDNRLDRNTGTMRGRAIFPNPDLFLTPGLFATVRIPGSAPYEAILIPDEAIGTEQSEKFVYVVGEGDVVERRVVELGITANGLRIVRSGLGRDERFVTRGLQRVFGAGVVVAPTEETLVDEPAADGLPDTYEPVSREDWLGRVPTPEPAEEGR